MNPDKKITINIHYDTAVPDMATLGELLKKFSGFIDDMEGLGCEVTMTMDGVTYFTPKPEESEDVS